MMAAGDFGGGGTKRPLLEMPSFFAQTSAFVSV
jgi:hypothetical protein